MKQPRNCEEMSNSWWNSIWLKKIWSKVIKEKYSNLINRLWYSKKDNMETLTASMTVPVIAEEVAIFMGKKKLPKMR